MMKLWSRCFHEKAVPSKKSNLPDANVETNSKYDLENQLNINELPLEVLFLIIERLDKVSIFYCFFVCRRWRSIVFSIAHVGKGNVVWCFLYQQYLMDSFYQQNSNSNSLLSLQESIESCLLWNYKCSISLSKSFPVINAVQITVYRDNLIVVTERDVKYYNKKTFKIKKTICLDKCHDFIENDFMVARSIKYNGEGYHLQLFGKRSYDDNEWESQITRELTEILTAQELDVRLFKIEENRCYVILKSNNSLYSYHWQYGDTPVEWHRRFRCRYYGSSGKIIAMYLGLNEVYLLTRSGALLCYQRLRGGVNITKVYTFSEVMEPGFVQLVHRNNVLLSVPDDRPARIMRIRREIGKDLYKIGKGFPILYRFEIRRLTCVTEHGIVLFLGFSDGKVKIIRPMDSSRGNINKHYIDLSVFEKGPPAPVVSIVVNVDDGKQCVFVATTTSVYRFTSNFPDEEYIWDKENLVGISGAPSVELVSI